MITAILVLHLALMLAIFVWLEKANFSVSRPRAFPSFLTSSNGLEEFDSID